jgi:hypothetical protein
MVLLSCLARRARQANTGQLAEGDLKDSALG